MMHIFNFYPGLAIGSMWPFSHGSQIEFVWIAHAKSLLQRVVGRPVGAEGRFGLG